MLHVKARHKISNAGFDELLASMNRVVIDPDFPTKTDDAKKVLKPLEDALPISQTEFCMTGCHRFGPDVQAEPNCPVCEKPRRDENGTRTTCTFSKFNLKDKLRALFAQPSMVSLLKSHASHVPTPESTHDVYGTPCSLKGLRVLCYYFLNFLRLIPTSYAILRCRLHRLRAKEGRLPRLL
jgi:hypothetical protein